MRINAFVLTETNRVAGTRKGLRRQWPFSSSVYSDAPRSIQFSAEKEEIDVRGCIVAGEIYAKFFKPLAQSSTNDCVPARKRDVLLNRKRVSDARRENLLQCPDLRWFPSGFLLMRL